jgi:predicted nucleotidyltransferase
MDRDFALRELTRLARVLASQRPEVEEVVLFGSLATNRAVPGSDADLLLVLKDAVPSFRDRIPLYAPAFDAAPVPCDLFPYTRAEVERMKRRPSLVKTALAQGHSLLTER